MLRFNCMESILFNCPFIIFLLSLLKTAQGDMLPINCVPTLVEGEQPFLKVSGSEFVHL